MFHLGDDFLCPTKFLLPPGDNGENLEAAASEENEINDDLYKFRALNGHQGPPKSPDPNWKSASIMSLLYGRLGRRPMTLSQPWQQMIQLHTTLMVKKMIFYMLKA